MTTAMDDATCWSIVESLGPDLSIARLTAALGVLTDAELSTFNRWLRRVDEHLDTPAHRSEAGTAYEISHSTTIARWGAPLTQQGPADFDELRATVIACGHDAWQAVVARPELLSGGWPTGLGRAFLRAVADAQPHPSGAGAPGHAAPPAAR